MELISNVNGLEVRLPARRDEYRHRYPICESYQPAFFALFMESDPTPLLFADYNAEVGSNAVPWHVYHGRSLRFEFPNEAMLKDVRKCMNKIAPMCAELCASYRTEWDGNNIVGVSDPKLRDRIQETIDSFFDIERY